MKNIIDWFRGSTLAMVGLAVLVLVLVLNVSKFGIFLWAVACVFTAGYVGYWVHRIASRDRLDAKAATDKMNTIRMARAVIQAACIIGFAIITS